MTVVPTPKPMNWEKPNFFTHIYTTHASLIIRDYVASNKKEKIRRAKIESDIIRLTYENPDLPLQYKVSCTSMIIHTNTFNRFWMDQFYLYDLPTKSVKRLTPNYRLIEELPCPPGNAGADGGGEGEEDADYDENIDNFIPKPIAVTKPVKGKAGNRQPATTRQTKGATAKKATTMTTAATTTARKNSKALSARTPLPTKTTLGDTSSDQMNLMNKPTKRPYTYKIENSPKRPKSAREAYLECIQQGLNDPSMRGPSSDEEMTTTDDEDESEAP